MYFFVMIVCKNLSNINFIRIMLSDIRTPQKNRSNNSIKSNTGLNLPGINKLHKHPSTERKSNKSYLQTVNNLSPNVQYDDKNTNYINNQQFRLKSILKKMNDDTMHMIDSIRPKRNIQRISKQQLSILAESSIENSKKMISNLQYDIKKLEEKFKKIVQQQQEEQLISKIKEIREQIEYLKTKNVGIKFNIQKDGKEIVKEYGEQPDYKINFVEGDLHSYQTRREKLTSDNKRVIDQTKSVQAKLAEIQTKIPTFQEQYKSIKQKQLVLTSNKNKELTLNQRKIQLEAIKKRMQFQNSNMQYKYYKLLRDLEYEKAGCTAIDQKLIIYEEKAGKTKEQLERLEAHIKSIRRNKIQKSRFVLEYLQHQKRPKEQFGSNSTFLKDYTDQHKNSTSELKANPIKKWYSQRPEQKTQQNENLETISQFAINNKNNEGKQEIINDGRLTPQKQQMQKSIVQLKKKQLIIQLGQNSQEINNQNRSNEV